MLAPFFEAVRLFRGPDLPAGGRFRVDEFAPTPGAIEILPPKQGGRSIAQNPFGSGPILRPKKTWRVRAHVEHQSAYQQSTSLENGRGDRVVVARDHWFPPINIPVGRIERGE